MTRVKLDMLLVRITTRMPSDVRNQLSEMIFNPNPEIKEQVLSLLRAHKIVIAEASKQLLEGSRNPVESIKDKSLREQREVNRLQMDLHAEQVELAEWTAELEKVRNEECIWKDKVQEAKGFGDRLEFEQKLTMLQREVDLRQRRSQVDFEAKDLAFAKINSGLQALDDISTDLNDLMRWCRGP